MSCHLIQRGLQLKINGRHYEVDRLLEKNLVVQLEEVTTGARLSYGVVKLQREVSAGSVVILGASTPVSHDAISGKATEPLPHLMSRLTAEQERAFNRKTAYVRAARRRGFGADSSVQLTNLILVVAEKLQDDKPPAASSLARWLTTYEQSGCNFVSLVPKTAFRRTAPRTPEWVISVAWASMRSHYFKRGGTTLRATFESYLRVHESKVRIHGIGGAAVSPLSWSTFWRLCQTVPAYERDRVRKGATYADRKWRKSSGGVYATRPLERVEMDHTMLDTYVIDDERCIPLGRPTLTMIIDSFTNYILAIYISFEGESLGRVAKSIRMALSLKDDMVAAVGAQNEWITPGMWECLVVDNALAFQSPQLKRIANVLGCDLEFGPVRKPWFKGTVERFMLEISKLLPAEGRTRKPGEVGDPYDPYKSACITFKALSSIIIKWAVDVHPFEIPERTLARPIDKLKEGLCVEPAPVLAPDLDELRFLTAMEKSVSIGAGGVEFLSLAYRSPALADMARRQSLPTFKTSMRYDPGDLGAIWVNDPMTGDWISVPCLHPDYAEGLSVYQHKYLRARARATLRNNGAVEYLLQAKADLRDLISSAVRGGKRLKRGLRQRAVLEGVSSDTSLVKQDSGCEVPAASSEVPLTLAEDEVPTFDVFDPRARDGWE
ncbi:Mu transposase C-terminal domain-containing protein [Achromobacter dolens]|uniref:Mu transposase C-terminal domain-containing protein n=1 Tax=Achromobacter dolens TaxID=1287738 RepID=UPI00300C9E82